MAGVPNYMTKSVEPMVVCAVPHPPSDRGIADSIDGKKFSNPLVPPVSPGDEDHEEQKRRDASWKAMKYSFIAFGATFGILGSYMVYELGNHELRRFKGQITVWVYISGNFPVPKWSYIFGLGFIRLQCVKSA
jgi:hypothetical protein